MSSSMNEPLEALCSRLARQHHLVGWCGLLVFLTLGAVLEGLHGFKLGFYLDPASKVRREMWTLAHAHGTLLALVQIAFAAGLERFGRWTPGRLRLASLFLLDAAVLIPVGFFLGGVAPTESDPWYGILLVPAGALLLFFGVLLVIVSALRSGHSPTIQQSEGTLTVRGN